MVELPPKLKVFQNKRLTSQAPLVIANCSGKRVESAAALTASPASMAEAV